MAAELDQFKPAIRYSGRVCTALTATATAPSAT
jgi:hypothetical protein